MPASPTTARTLLASKLNPPTPHPSQIARTRVSDLVCASPATRLVLVRAPAGFGKTTAMMQCMAAFERRDIVTAWLTLDDADNDVSRFLSGLGAAANDIARYGSDSFVDERSPGDTALDIVARLASDEAPFALFLDDFERITEPAVLGLMREIIEHLPPRGQLIVGSRSLPDFGLGRLRARGQLLEIDTARLRFSLAETNDFFTGKRNLILAEHDLNEIHRKTEGWVAGLWLASLALERNHEPARFIERFSGANHTVAEYLAEDVLDYQPAHIRDFLLRTSVLKRINVPLCNALLPGVDSETLLQQLVATNIFLAPIEGEQRIYRYHSLFADFLRSRLKRELPDEWPRLHRAAADWYESQHRPVPSIDHALEACDFGRALRLLAVYAEPLLAQGRMRLLARWFHTLGDDRLREHPLLQVIHVWALCFTGGPEQAMAVLQNTELENSTDPRIRPHVLAIRPSLLATMDRFEEAYERGHAVLSQVCCDDAFAYATLANAMANIASVIGHYDEARELLEGARSAQGTHASLFNVMYTESVEGIIDLHEGRQRQAAARFRLAVDATSRAPSYSQTNGNAWAGVLHARAVYESNRLVQAARLLHVYVPLVKDIGLADHMILGDVMRSRIAFHNGDVDRAFQLLTELEHTGHMRQLPRVVATARLERSRVFLLQGRDTAAKTELDRADDKTVWERVERLRLTANDIETIELGRLRWVVLAGDAAPACPQLEREIRRAVKGARHRRALKLRLLLAMALHRSGETLGALALIEKVLTAACTEGYLRLILDEGPAAGQLVMLFQAKAREAGLDRRDPILAEYIQSLLQAFGPIVTEAPRPADPQADLVEPLTRREIRALQLLAEGYSNGAMAEKLFVSDSTVRTHLRNINAKLDANSRTQAVAIARRLGVV